MYLQTREIHLFMQSGAQSKGASGTPVAVVTGGPTKRFGCLKGPECAPTRIEGDHLKDIQFHVKPPQKLDVIDLLVTQVQRTQGKKKCAHVYWWGGPYAHMGPLEDPMRYVLRFICSRLAPVPKAP